MYLSRTGPVYPDAISLRKALRNWGEGASNAGDPGGHGTQALTGDATWLHTFYSTSFWTTPGGDFSPTITATTSVEIWGQNYQWSSAGLLADVQSWVSNPAGNFGWGILGDEVDLGSAVRFGSGQYPTNPPRLIITFQAPTPTPTPTPVLVATVTLPTATVLTSATNFTQPVVTSAVNAGDNLIGFQGDFTFDETVVTFQNPPVSNSGLSGGNWNVTGNVIPGAGPIRTLRVSAFSNDFTPLSGSGTLYTLNMTRVSSTPGATSPLVWKTAPDNFFFIDVDLGTHAPGSTPPGSITIQAATASISGSVVQCAGATSNALAGVTMTLTGTSGGSTTTDGSGNYSFTGLVSGGSFTVTPTKAARIPGSSGINTTDVVAAQRHFLNLTLLTGCRLTAADVNASGGVNTTDVIAIQRFFLGMSTGTANVGKYGFTPVNRAYSPLSSDQSGQNFDTVVFGDCATPFANPRGIGPAPDAASEDSIASTVAEVALPEVAADQLRTLSRVESRTNFTAAVTASAIDGKNKLVGFQGDFTFDERVVSFESEPVQRAGITGGNWNVSGNVLAGKGPIRTLRVSAYSNDFKPLSGKGTLFELRMTTVNSTPGASTQLSWAASPDNFIFIDADLNTQSPGHAASGSVGAPSSQR